MIAGFCRTGESPTLCIMSPNKNAYSETFIHAHIERLPANVRVIYGQRFPYYWDDAGQQLPFTLPCRLIGAILRRVLRLTDSYFDKAPIIRFLLRYKVDAVLAEYGPTGVAVVDVCRRANLPLIVHFHGYDAYRQTVLEEACMYQEIFKSAAAIVVVSRDMERQLLDLGAPREKLHYNPYGVDLALFKSGEPAAHASPIFVAVGRFVDKKAPHLTLLAFSKVNQRIPEARLVMIGNGELWYACKQLARALKIADAVQFCGPLSHAEVGAIMQQARAFVQHSIRTDYGDSEGTPVVVLEAGAAGLPVVATRHAGIQDVVVDGKTGLLVDEGDVEGMAECMIRLADNPALASQLGNAARERIAAEFTMEKSISNLWSIIEEAVLNDRFRSFSRV